MHRPTNCTSREPESPQTKSVSSFCSTQRPVGDKFYNKIQPIPEIGSPFCARQCPLKLKFNNPALWAYFVVKHMVADGGWIWRKDGRYFHNKSHQNNYPCGRFAAPFMWSILGPPNGRPFFFWHCLEQNSFGPHLTFKNFFYKIKKKS